MASMAVESENEVKVGEPRKKTQEEIFLEHTVERQEAVQARILSHLKVVGGEGCFICELWELRLWGFWDRGEDVINKFDVTTALSVFKRKKQIVVRGGLRVALMYRWLL